MKSWVAKHTGLPSFYSPTPVRVVAPDGRVLADGTLPVMVSDALAVPGVKCAYRVGGQTVHLTRTSSSEGNQIITDLKGRGVSGLGAQPAGSISWNPDVRVSRSGTVVYPMKERGRESEIRVLAYSEDKSFDLWNLLKKEKKVIVGTGQPVLGLDRLRPVVVLSVRSDLLGGGINRFSIRYVEVTERLSGAAPVLTWGEWAEYDGGVWRARTTEALLRAVAGMP